TSSGASPHPATSGAGSLGREPAPAGDPSSRIRSRRSHGVSRRRVRAAAWPTPPSSSGRADLLDATEWSWAFAVVGPVGCVKKWQLRALAVLTAKERHRNYCGRIADARPA